MLLVSAYGVSRRILVALGEGSPEDNPFYLGGANLSNSSEKPVLESWA